MKHKRFRTAAVIIACVILASFILLTPHTRDEVGTSLSPVATTTVPTVSIRDVFKKGAHTISGSIIAPNPCVSVTAVAVGLNATSSSARILVDVSMSKDSGVCLQESTERTFSATVIAPAKVPITVRVNGTVASTTEL